MLKQLKHINQEMRLHHLSWPLAVFGVLLAMAATPGVVLAPVVFLACLQAKLGEPVPDIILQHHRYVLDPWFWSTMFLISLGMLTFGMYLHPEAQLERKLGKHAVEEYKDLCGWPW